MPSILRPDFTWPRPMQPTVSTTTPPVPRIPAKTIRIIWGIIHRGLYHFSQWYCSWFNIQFDANIVQLPFGLVMKWTDRTSVEEAIAMQMARAAGIPVPNVLGCGTHLDAPFNRRVSILMTRLPGVALGNSTDPLEVDAEDPWLEELKTCIHSMRLWSRPDQDQNSICSRIGTAIRSSRVPDHIMGPFPDKKEFYNHLFRPASSSGFESMAEYEKTLAHAIRLQQYPPSDYIHPRGSQSS